VTHFVAEEGAPLRGDGTPFPADPALWSAEEAEYLERYWFTGELVTSVEVEQVGYVEHVPDLSEPHG
jgi:hypothetical protein